VRGCFKTTSWRSSEKANVVGKLYLLATKKVDLSVVEGEGTQVLVVVLNFGECGCECGVNGKHVVLNLLDDISTPATAWA